jgi:hypothetical protein
MADIETESSIDDDSDEEFEISANSTESEVADIEIRESQEETLRRKHIRRLLERRLERKRLREELDDFIDYDEDNEESEEEDNAP